MKCKDEESVRLEKSACKLTRDKDFTPAELSAVVVYLAKLKNDMCVAKADTCGETARRRAAGIAGLQEALSVLSECAVLQQPKSLHRVCVQRHWALLREYVEPDAVMNATQWSIFRVPILEV